MSQIYDIMTKNEIAEYKIRNGLLIAYDEQDLENVLRFYDFNFWKQRYRFKPKYERATIKLPAFGVRDAIVLFMLLHEDRFSLFESKLQERFPAMVIETLFFQVYEYEFVKRRGYTAHQYKHVKTYNRHDFMPLFGQNHVNI